MFVSIPDDDLYNYPECIRNSPASYHKSEDIGNDLEINDFKIEDEVTDDAEETKEHGESLQQRQFSEQAEEMFTNSDTASEEEEVISEGLRKLLDPMVNDEIGSLVQNDNLILDFGARLFARLRQRKHYGYIRAKMRELGRLLLHLKKKDQNANLESFIHPSKFPEVVSAVSEMTAGEDGECNKPNLVIQLGCSMHDAAKIVRGKAIRNGDKVKTAEAEGYIQFYKRDWKVQISSNAVEMLKERRQSRSDTLPRNEDVRKITMALDRDITEAKQVLETEPSLAAYAKLSRAAVSAIMLFNQRRPGEPSQLTVTEYRQRRSAVDEELAQSLSPLEQELFISMGYVETTGWRGCRMPVLLTSKLRGALDLLVAVREAVGIGAEHPFIFVSANGNTFRSNDCNRIAEQKIRAVNILTTRCSKRLATMLQLAQLSEAEMEIVAEFLGQHMLDKELCRLSDGTVDVAKVAELLMATEKGMGASFGSTPDVPHPAMDSTEDVGHPAGGKMSRIGIGRKRYRNGEQQRRVLSKRRKP